jgi:lipopolysaccharide export system permease protein
MLFDSTVRKELARGFGASLVVILTVMITNFLIKTVGQAAKGAVAPQDVVLLLGYVTIGYLPTVLALALFIAVVIALGRMYRDSEMVIWFASGVGLRRFVQPVLRASWPVLLLVGLLVLFAWPWGNRSSRELADRYQSRSDLSRVAPGVFQTSSDGRRVFFVERDSSSADGSGTSSKGDGSGNGSGSESASAPGLARNVFILSNQAHSESVTSAKSGRLETVGDNRYLVLERGQNNMADTRAAGAGSAGERSLASFETYRVLVSEGVARAATRQAPKVMRTIDLIRDPSARNQAELTWRFGLLIGAGNLVLLGIGLAASNPRRASNWTLLFALLAFVVYYNLINLSQAWVGNGRLSMGVALLAVHGGVFVLAMLLLWWRDHAAVLRWRFGKAAS